MLFFYLADLCGRRAASLAPLCKGSCRRSGLSGCFSLRWAGGASLSPFSAPNQLFELLRCSAWLIHDFAPSPMRALVFRSAYSASRNARASAAFAASIKAHCAVGTETLMLQVRSAHPPMPHRNVFSKHPGVPLGLFGKPKRSSSSRFAAFGGRGELRSPLHPPLPPPRILERQTGTPFGLYSAKGASLPSQRLRGCPLPLPLPLCYHKHK